MTSLQQAAPWGDRCAWRRRDKGERVAKEQCQSRPVTWCNTVIGGQWPVGVCVDGLKPGLEGAEELAKPLEQAQDFVHRSAMNVASG